MKRKNYNNIEGKPSVSYDGYYVTVHYDTKKSHELTYYVTSCGKVVNMRTGEVMKTRIQRDGYELVNLGPVSIQVHTLVGRTHLADYYEKGLEIDHLNKDRSCNKLNNLEWVTHQENLKRR